MSPDARLFLDTAFVQASLNSRDRYHLQRFGYCQLYRQRLKSGPPKPYWLKWVTHSVRLIGPLPLVLSNTAISRPICT